MGRSGSSGRQPSMSVTHRAPTTDEPAIRCSTLQHLQWTHDFDWHAIGSGRRVTDGWLERASNWRSGRPGTEVWVQQLSDIRQPSWQALQAAQRSVGLNPRFRESAASCRGRFYSLRPGLAERFERKLNADSIDDVTPVARAIRGFLDICHVHPFDDGNARAAFAKVGWGLGPTARQNPHPTPKTQPTAAKVMSGLAGT